MVVYQYLVFDTKGTRDADGNIIKPPTDQQKKLGQIYSAAYSISVIIFGSLYK
jgi:hypothetical protein